MPNYQPYMIKTRRVAAATCLLELSQYMERFYTVNLRYDQNSSGAAVALPATQCQTDLAGHYAFSLNPDPTARTYTLGAAPQGAQSTKDPLLCGTLTINQAGQKGAEADVSKCWR
ncbi:MAG: pilus assembly protein PilE [Azoarcus sp.]|nr:pilus assembly protein PilE [Azoarcus sp.]